MNKEHLSKHYDHLLETIRSHVLQMGGMVEAQFQNAMKALDERDEALAEKVLASDVEINQLEIRLDKACTELIVKRQPAANDLRTVMATTKIITDLERIGDEAIKIARSAKNIQNRNMAILNGYQTIRVLAETASGMLRDALDAFARMDKDLAINLIGRDDIIDHDFHAMMRNLITYMMEEPKTISASLDLLWIAKAIERIGDHSTNLGEQVIYIVEGKDIRHSDYVANILEQEK
ncbi:MAG: phosphate transport system regulatory protein PhoU [Oxalobacter sp.]|nr:MAG: phosphate transport system regulatory protein PhoU [Oxalobacter sp.]